eukprot:TRINITY_DN9463_c0_g3_i1.p1 TRINITY_DN9463_c0_g3~~TRINITY_DN9463_c0_g3_i1.p1  ORF type:complete len:267 (-),score=24.14 TRINITY_DN9463_c0_g3_i1:34-750(-)
MYRYFRWCSGGLDLPAAITSRGEAESNARSSLNLSMRPPQEHPEVKREHAASTECDEDVSVPPAAPSTQIADENRIRSAGPVRPRVVIFRKKSPTPLRKTRSCSRVMQARLGTLDRLAKPAAVPGSEVLSPSELGEDHLAIIVRNMAGDILWQMPASKLAWFTSLPLGRFVAKHVGKSGNIVSLVLHGRSLPTYVTVGEIACLEPRGGTKEIVILFQALPDMYTCSCPAYLMRDDGVF